MIAYLRGKVIDVSSEDLVLDVQGVGYELTCSSTTLSQVQGEDFVSLFVHTHVREDAIHLFGFASQKEKQLFLSLVKVNGIGPKMASQVLSAAPVDTVYQYIEEGDAKGLASLPKIGKKKAEQIILSLKGKLVSAEPEKNKSNWSLTREEISSALVHLGFRSQDVRKVVEGLPNTITVQDGIREGLSKLSSAGQQSRGTANRVEV